MRVTTLSLPKVTQSVWALYVHLFRKNSLKDLEIESVLYLYGPLYNIDTSAKSAEKK